MERRNKTNTEERYAEQESALGRSLGAGTLLSSHPHLSPPPQPADTSPLVQLCSIPFLPLDLGGEERRRELQARRSSHPKSQRPRHSAGVSPGPSYHFCISHEGSAWRDSSFSCLEGGKGEENLN